MSSDSLLPCYLISRFDSEWRRECSGRGGGIKYSSHFSMQLVSLEYVLTRHIPRLTKRVCGHKSRLWVFVTHIQMWMPKFCLNVWKCFYAVVRELNLFFVCKSWNCKFWAMQIDTHTGSQSGTAAVLQWPCCEWACRKIWAFIVSCGLLSSSEICSVNLFMIKALWMTLSLCISWGS